MVTGVVLVVIKVKDSSLLDPSLLDPSLLDPSLLDPSLLDPSLLEAEGAITSVDLQGLH